MDSEKKKRRSSILKPQKPKSPQVTNVESTITKYKEKRVSFASSNFVKPFAADPEKNTIWDNTYEEEVNHTDSVKNTDSHADVHVPTLNILVLDNSSLHIPKLDKENILPVHCKLENSSEIKIYNDFEKETSIVECIKKNKTVIFDDNVMELTSLRSEKSIINNEIEQMEFTTDLQGGNFSNQCYESNMEFTALVGYANEEQTDLLKKEESVLFPSISTELKLHHVQNRETNQKDEGKDILLTNSQSIEFTNILTNMQDISHVQNKAENQENYSKLNRTQDMEFTDVLPSIQKILQSQSTPRATNQREDIENYHTLLNESATIECTDVFPGIQEILKTVTAESKRGGSGVISNVSEYVDMELTNVLPSPQKILQYPKPVKTDIHSKVRNNQTILNESVIMEFTNVLPDIQEILKTVPPEKKEDSCKALSVLNLSANMDFTDILPSAQNILQHPNNIIQCTMELTNVLPDTQEIFKSVDQVMKQEGSSKDLSKLNQSADMEFTNILQSPQKVLQSETTVKTVQLNNDLENISSSVKKLDKFKDNVHEILRTVQSERQEYSCKNLSNVNQTMDMEFTNIFPNTPQNLPYPNTVTSVQLTNKCKNLDISNISDKIQSIVRNNNTILNESVTMEFTNMLPVPHDISKSVPAKGETSDGEDISKFNQTVDMEFTNVSPNPFQAAASSFECKELTKPENTVLPSVQNISIFHGMNINTQQKIMESHGTSEIKNIESENVRKAKKSLHFESMAFGNEMVSGRDCSKVDDTENMNILEVSPNPVDILKTSFTKLSDKQNIKDIEDEANDRKNNRTKTMNTTKSRNTNPKPTEAFTISKTNKEFINISHNLHPDNVEKTYTKTSLSENITNTTDRSLLYHKNLDEKTDAENISLLGKGDSISSINKTSQSEIIKNIRSLRRETIYDRGNESEVSSTELSNNETGVNIMDNVYIDTRDRRSRKTMYFNTEDNSVENIMIGNLSCQSSETSLALEQNEQLGRSPKNNVLYSEPGYLNAQDMTTHPNLAITPSTSFGINLSPCVSQQRVLATVQPSDSLQDIFRHKSFESESFSVLDEKFVSDTQNPDRNEQDMVTEHHDVIDLTLKGQPDQLDVYVLDDTSAVLIDDSDNTLDSNCDYTRHCRTILRNLENYLVPGDTLMPTKHGKNREKRFKEICKQLEEVKSKVDEFRENFTLPSLDWMNFEEIFKQCKEDSSKDNMTDESLLLETKVPKLKESRLLVERVQEAAKRSTSYWQFIKCEKDHYYFTTLFETLPFIVHLHPELGIVYRVETFKNMKDNLQPIFCYNHDYLQFKLKHDNLISVLGSKYDILTLLDYICMTLTEVVEFHHNLKQLEEKYGSSHKLRMTSDFRVILEILSEELIIWWIISIKLSKTTIGLAEDITATSELGEKVNEDHIKQIGEKIESGSVKLYVESLIQKIDEYVQRVGRGIRYRREYETVG